MYVTFDQLNNQYALLYPELQLQLTKCNTKRQHVALIRTFPRTLKPTTRCVASGKLYIIVVWLLQYLRCIVYGYGFLQLQHQLGPPGTFADATL